MAGLVGGSRRSVGVERGKSAEAPAALSALAEPARDKAKLPKSVQPVHGMRHAHGTLQIGSGVDQVTASRAMGHSTTILINVYTHPTEEMVAPLASNVVEALGEALDNL